MKDLRSQLAETIDLLSPIEGLSASPIPGVHCIKFSKTERRTRRRWHACLGIIAQGCKEMVLGRKVYRFDDGHYTVTPIDLPVVSRIASASPARPFLGLLIDLDPMILAELSAQLNREITVEPDNSLRAVFFGKASEEMLEAAVRL